MKYALIALALVMGTALAQKQDKDTYRWTDKDGKVHYGTTPPAGANAKKVEKRISSATAPAAGNKSGAAPKAIPFKSVTTENVRKPKEDSDKPKR
jgi:hypothetical protein